ncbi:MAG: ABC transporter substrate-binding protein [Chloroflexi bacterium]|nr:ABC transporter substrate-binding protein [Chloroflexota bacterium]
MRPIHQLAVLIAAGVLLSACGGSATPAPKSAEAPTTAPAKPAAPAAPAAPAPAASPAAPTSPAPAASPAAPAAASPAAPAAASPAAASKPSGPVTELSVALLPNLNYISFFAGVERGIFLKHGIDMKLKVVSTAPDAVKALGAGDTQLTIGVWSGLAPARAQGLDVKMFYFLVSEPWDVNYDRQNAIVVRPGVNANTVADLKGLKVGFPFGSGNDTYVRQHIAKAGLKPDEVTYVNVPTQNLPAAIAAGQIDAAGTSEPYGMMTLTQTPGSKELVRSGNVYDGRIAAAASGAWLDKNPALAEQTWAALAESAQWVRQNPDQAAVVASHVLTLDVPLLRKALDYVSLDPRVSSKFRQAFEDENRVLVEQKKMPAAVPVSEMFPEAQIREWQKKYAQYTSDLKPLPE